jgi:class 3 adenylate cyclase
MATERQLQLEQVFRRALEEHGPGASTEFLIAATSEQTQADPREIIEAVEVVDRRPGRQGPDEGTGGSYEDAITLLLALGKAVTAIWSNLPQDVQHELFEHAVSAQDDTTRERLAVFLHAIHFRTTDGIKARAIPEPDSLGG